MQVRKHKSEAVTAVGDEAVASPARRRFLRMGGIAAAGAAAAAVATASPAGAGVDGDLTLGSVVNTATTATGLSVTGSAAQYGLGVTDNGGSSLNGQKPSLFAHAKNQNFGTAIYALGQGADVIALRAESPSGGAIEASCESGFSTIRANNGGGGPAVEAVSSGYAAVTAEVVTGGGVGVIAVSHGSGQAMQALSQGTGPALTAVTESPTNPNPALRATSASAQPAVKAIGKTVAVSAAVPIAGNAAALAVQGVATFTRSGVASLAAAGASIVVSVPGGLTANSHVLATLQTNVAGVAVRAVVPNPANGKMTIFLTASAPAATKVAWFVFG
jgi:hypothetical protein